MKNYKKIIVAVLLLGLVGMGIFAYRVYYTFFGKNTSFAGASYEVLIPTGADYKQAFQIIAEAVNDREALHQTAVRKGYVDNVKPGRYILRAGMNNHEIINTVRSRNIPVNVRFNNQERIEDLAGRIASQIETDSLTLLNAMLDEEFLEQEGFTGENALTMYLPNQYEVYWNTSAEGFRSRMLDYYNSYWNEDRRAKAEKLDLTPQEIYTLASIVHKETAKVDERPRVAGVYLNRIERGMKLDADPTVIYANRKLNNDFKLVIKRVLFKHLEADSPYNTYKYAGLPPGPIVTPDLSAIEGVLNAEDHDYLYFVVDMDNFGYHKFAKTHAQHTRNAAAYRRWIARQ